ncbi:bomanin Bicipital 1-like [Drosophila rhopaloa]|uniref:Immune-induced peptide 23-like n=1 Tax=Drosophila rhopaloa TaxID=1041015 RepID=A0A6P4EP71_DRORH|nr:bomanin Bicipital 1-like [Drosophila rhopaloa]
MKCLTLLALLFLATLAFVQAGKVTINGKCVDCSNDHTTTTTTHKPLRGRGNGGKTTARPRPKSTPTHRRPSSDEDDNELDGWSLHQSAGGSQHIARRSKRQWGGGQYIDLGGSGGRGGGGSGGGGWSGGGVTTIDSRPYPGGTLVRNSDCVGCNIRG